MSARIAVFHPARLAGMLCATPALRALRRGYPEARITLVGLPWARSLAGRLAGVDDFIDFPGWPGLAGRTPADLRALPRFLATVRARHFDLALQFDGEDRAADALVAAFGARQCAGRGAAAPPGCDVERLLALTDRLGLARHGSGLDFPLRDTDREAADRLCAPLRGQRFAIVHAGAPRPSLRDPVARYAAAADALAADGLAIVLTGSAAEAGLTRAIAAAMRAPALDLAGCTTLWSLGALVEWAAQVVCDGHGITRLAAALGTPCVACTPGVGALRPPAPAVRHAVPGAATQDGRIAA